ncbi:MAG: class I SAM-dependent methyltransferase, partial [Bryobacteraceae bacterium]
VIAQDIFPDFLKRAKEKAAGENLSNVQFVLGNDKQTKLPEAAADLILVLDVYHHFDYPARMLADLKKALKPDGRLAIVDYHKNKESMSNGRALKHIRLTDKEAVKEVESNGWKLVSKSEHIPRVQWLGIFRKG